MLEKVAVVGGGGSGIGRAVSLALAKAEYKVVVLGRTLGKIESVQKELSDDGFQAYAFPADLSKEHDVKSVFSKIDALLGRIDVLVNSTGAKGSSPLDEMSLSVWNDIMASALTAPFLCTREALKRMKKQRRGRIVNIGSTSGKRVRPNSAAYSSAKHGLWGLTQVTALEGRGFNIGCTCLNPGRVDVEWRTLKEGDEPVISAQTFAETVLHICNLPDEVCVLEATVLHNNQPFIGRG
ncbi:MAG: SDR family oxidoreductase [Proteobacteria bacterium]|nr:SDR family oxidoreductase [Pseudomonadota bacterium]